MADKLKRLFEEHGQSPWLDNLKRSYISSGHLGTVISSGIRGLTSNPTIFQKAIQGSNEYSEQFRELIKDKKSINESYWELVLRDIHGALELFTPLYESSGGLDGFVSVEVDPGLANESEQTLIAARELHQRVNRSNVMIKIPATQVCLPAIQTMISEGRNVNVTLIFSLERYRQVVEQYILGLEILASTNPAKLREVSSVASFFISRVDTEIDNRLAKDGSDLALSLCGTAAVNQAKLAYQIFEQSFSGPRWNKLEALGAKVQRPLWASTSTKNPQYSPTLYVDQLIGPNTVNTLPEATVDAFAKSGSLAETIRVDLDKAEWQWHQLGNCGVDVNDVAKVLEDEGVVSFQSSFDQLIEALRSKATEIM